jgi:hypothetical protein
MGSGIQIAPNNNKDSYYEEILGGHEYILAYIPILGSSDSQF